MLNHISDLSSDEDSPTLNTGGDRSSDQFILGSASAVAFVQGFAAMHLSGCNGSGESPYHDVNRYNFATMVLTDYLDFVLGSIYMVVATQPSHLECPATSNTICGDDSNFSRWSQR